MSPITKIEIRAVPPSVNEMYKRTRNGNTFKSDKYKAFEKICMFLSYSGPDLKGNFPYKVKVDFYGKWLTKNNSMRKRDCDNNLKCLFDALSKRLNCGWDDHQIFEIHVRKINYVEGAEHTKLYFYPLGKIEEL